MAVEKISARPSLPGSGGAAISRKIGRSNLAAIAASMPPAAASEKPEHSQSQLVSATLLTP